MYVYVYTIPGNWLGSLAYRRPESTTQVKATLFFPCIFLVPAGPRLFFRRAQLDQAYFMTPLQQHVLPARSGNPRTVVNVESNGASTTDRYYCHHR